MGKLFEVVSDLLGPALKDLAEDAKKLLGAFADLFRWLGKVVGDAATFYGIDTKGSGRDKEMEGKASSAFADFAEMLRKMREKFKIAIPDPTKAMASAKQPRMQARAQGKTTQDFRFSRFDITQKFEEGFDPDRFLVAFSQDLARAGEMKVQTGFEPIYTSR